MAARWNPARTWIERTITKEAERRAALVTEGRDSPAYARMYRRGALRFYLAILLVGALITLVPEPYELVAATLATTLCFAMMRNGAFRDSEAARNYVDGWIEGRMALFNRIAEEIPNGSEALFDAVRLENHRDVEVLLNIRTTQAPDDLSGLDGQ